MSNLHLFLLVLGMAAFATVMALTLTIVLEKAEKRDEL